MNKIHVVADKAGSVINYKNREGTRGGRKLLTLADEGTSPPAATGLQGGCRPLGFGSVPNKGHLLRENWLCTFSMRPYNKPP